MSRIQRVNETGQNSRIKNAASYKQGSKNFDLISEFDDVQKKLFDHQELIIKKLD